MPPPSEVQVICQWNKYDISKASARIDTKNGTQKMMEMKPFILSLFYAVLYVRSRFWFRHAMLWVGEHSVIYLTWFFFSSVICAEIHNFRFWFASFGINFHVIL